MICKGDDDNDFLCFLLNFEREIIVINFFPDENSQIRIFSSLCRMFSPDKFSLKFFYFISFFFAFFLRRNFDFVGPSTSLFPLPSPVVIRIKSKKRSPFSPFLSLLQTLSSSFSLSFLFRNQFKSK